MDKFIPKTPGAIIAVSLALIGFIFLFDIAISIYLAPEPPSEAYQDAFKQLEQKHEAIQNPEESGEGASQSEAPPPDSAPN
jgi:hypothetical protein